jgi:hypothetical protein
MKLFLKKLVLVVAAMVLVANAQRCAAQEIKLGGHSATLRLNEKPSSRTATFTLPKPAKGKSWALTMLTTSSSGDVVASVKGKAAVSGEEISLITNLSSDAKKGETGMMFYRPKEPITVTVTFEIRLSDKPTGRGPWDGSITLRAIEEGYTK